MQPYFHLNVAGWKAYYQGPLYYRHWINTVFLPRRNNIATSLIGGGRAQINGDVSNIPQLINVIDYVSTIENALDPNVLIYGIASNMFTYPIAEEQKDYLKELLLPGLPDFEWTVEYSEFLSDPLNTDKRSAINRNLIALFFSPIFSST